MVRREGTGSIPCWASAGIMAVTPPPVPLWRNVRGKDTTAPAPCSGVCVGAFPPRREPALRAGQLSTDLLPLVLRTVWVAGLVTTGYGALGPRPCLGKQRLSWSEHAVCSLAWHTP